jgi:tol-pal system protein YbgF
MKERILELQEQAAVTEIEMDRLRVLMASLEQRLAGGDPPQTMESSSGISERVAPVAAGPSMSGSNQAAIEESDLAPEPPVSPAATSEGEEVPSSSGDATAGASSDRAGAGLQPVDPAAQALYDRGYTLYHQGKYLDAEASFQRFLQAYPSTELSDNAQFWIGEGRYARGDTRGALAAFREVLQKYPEGNKVPDALIKEGDCLEKLGDRDGARDRYNEVKRRFPDSGAAIMAEDRLAGLDG